MGHTDFSTVHAEWYVCTPDINSSFSSGQGSWKLSLAERCYEVEERVGSGQEMLWQDKIVAAVTWLWSDGCSADGGNLRGLISRMVITNLSVFGVYMYLSFVHTRTFLLISLTLILAIPARPGAFLSLWNPLRFPSSSWMPLLTLFLPKAFSSFQIFGGLRDVAAIQHCLLRKRRKGFLLHRGQQFVFPRPPSAIHCSGCWNLWWGLRAQVVTWEAVRRQSLTRTVTETVSIVSKPACLLLLPSDSSCTGLHRQWEQQLWKT